MGQLNKRKTKLKSLNQELITAKQDEKELKEDIEKLFVKNEEIQNDCYNIEQRCAVLTSQNKDLNIELDQFVMMDEQVRDQLNRR